MNGNREETGVFRGKGDNKKLTGRYNWTKMWKYFLWKHLPENFE